MKVKSLIKVACKSGKIKFGNEYDSNVDIILIDGCFVPLFKAKEDKRKVDMFYMDRKQDRIVLDITTEYIKETTIPKKKKEKKK